VLPPRAPTTPLIYFATGLAYAYLSDSAIHVLQHHTVATQLSQLASGGTSAGSRKAVTAATLPPKAFVLRYEWDAVSSGVEVLSGGSTIGSAWGYKLMAKNTTNYTDWNFTVSLHSLAADVAATPTSTTVTLTVNGGAEEGGHGQPKHAVVSAMGAATISWAGLDLSAYATGPAAVVEVDVNVAGGIAMPLRLQFHLGDWGCLASDTVPKPVDVCA
jgi:hypothetical protein